MADGSGDFSLLVLIGGRFDQNVTLEPISFCHFLLLGSSVNGNAIRLAGKLSKLIGNKSVNNQRAFIVESR